MDLQKTRLDKTAIAIGNRTYKLFPGKYITLTTSAGVLTQFHNKVDLPTFSTKPTIWWSVL